MKFKMAVLVKPTIGMDDMSNVAVNNCPHSRVTPWPSHFTAEQQKQQNNFKCTNQQKQQKQNS